LSGRVEEIHENFNQDIWSQAKIRTRLDEKCRPKKKDTEKILQLVDSLLGNDGETSNETTSAVRQQILNKQPLLSNAFANKHVPTETIGVQQ
jgi:hypothetical protein